MKDKLLQIINHYGINNQLKYIHSEYYELDESIFDYENAGFDFSDEDCKDIEEKYKKHIAEELSDCFVMLKQFQYYYGISDEDIESIMKSKIERQLERINKELLNQGE
jgi:NTP pyrophosphatase (non-canonical NTP hydrolase)